MTSTPQQFNVSKIVGLCPTGAVLDTDLMKRAELFKNQKGACLISLNTLHLLLNTFHAVLIALDSPVLLRYAVRRYTTVVWVL